MHDWSDLDVFHAVAEAGSFAAAARKLKISHPTVGRRLDALERRLGAPLVHRGAAGVDLTDLGAAIHDNVRRMALEAEAIGRLAAGGEQGLAGTVTVTALDGLGVVMLPRFLGELRALHPDLVINLEISARQANLAQREADIALRLGRPGDQASLIARRVAQIGMGFYAAPSYLEAHGRPTHVSGLAEHDAVTSTFGADHIWTPEIEGEPAEPRRVVFVSDSPSALAMATEAGMGIGTHSHWRARAAKSLERVLPHVELKTLDLWLVTHADIRRNARIRLVFDHLAARISQNAKWLLEGDPKVRERID
jgi:DNA-binding transcriptional LysR family regulator